MLAQGLQEQKDRFSGPNCVILLLKAIFVTVMISGVMEVIKMSTGKRLLVGRLRGARKKKQFQKVMVSRAGWQGCESLQMPSCLFWVHSLDTCRSFINILSTSNIGKHGLG